MDGMLGAKRTLWPMNFSWWFDRYSSVTLSEPNLSLTFELKTFKLSCILKTVNFFRSWVMAYYWARGESNQSTYWDTLVTSQMSLRPSAFIILLKYKIASHADLSSTILTVTIHSFQWHLPRIRPSSSRVYLTGSCSFHGGVPRTRQWH